MRPLSVKKSESMVSLSEAAQFGVPPSGGTDYAEIMSATGYVWRQLNPKQREELLELRKMRGYPWHSPPHRPNFAHLRFLISAACYGDHHYIGHNLARIDNFVRDLLAVLAAHANQAFAWSVLPNHYHALVEAADIKHLVYQLGRLHGRTSHAWNAEDAPADERFSFALSSAQCGRIDITGRR
jgi:REP element-mobilizing transposase RayT